MQADPRDTDEGRREIDVRVGLGMFASEDQLAHLLAIAHHVDVEPGHVLFREAESPTRVFQVIGGEVSMDALGAPRWKVKGGGTAGFVDFMQGRVHSRTATAATAARLVELDAADYREYLEDNFEVSHRMMSWLSHAIVADASVRQEGPVLLATADPVTSRLFSKVELSTVERLMLFSRMSEFGGASTQGLANLAQRAVEARFGPGEVIVAAGATTSVVSVLVEGEVELLLPSGARVRRAGRSFLAHLEELASSTRVNTVTALSPLIVLQLEREELLDRLEEHFDLTMALFAAVAREQDKLNHAAAASGIGLAIKHK